MYAYVSMRQDNSLNGSPQQPKPRFFKAHPILSALLLSIAIFLACALAVVLFLAAQFAGFASVCNQRTDRLDSAARTVASEMKMLSIDGKSPNEVKGQKNGDCLTGSGVVGTATFYATFPSVTLANQQVVQSLRSSSTSQAPHFTLGNHDDDTLVDFVQTTQTSDTGKVYEVNYYLTTPIYCPDHEYESSVCIDGTPPKDSRNYLSHPVRKIEIILRTAAESV